VRSVTQGDVIRADAKDIPRIFQVCKFALNSCVLQCLFDGKGQVRLSGMEVSAIHGK